MHTRRLDDHAGFSAEKMAKHNLFSTPRFFLDVYALLPRQAQKPHAHEGADKVYVVLEGTCRFTVGGETEEHGPGTAVLAPSGEEHGVVNPGPAPARLLVMMAPRP
jgi:mannose-6-phosphate isomerase-like protein (cupin superfamily)